MMTNQDPKLQDYATAANCLRIMGHPSRLAIAVLLLEGPCTVSEIEQKLGLRQPNLSQHLGVLRDAQLLSATRKAKSVTYELAEGWPVRRFVKEIADSYDLGSASARGLNDADSAVATGTSASSKASAAREAARAQASSKSDSGEASVFAHVLTPRG